MTDTPAPPTGSGAQEDELIRLLRENNRLLAEIRDHLVLPINVRTAPRPPQPQSEPDWKRPARPPVTP